MVKMTDNKLFERRVKMARMHIMGIPPTKIVETLVSEFGVSKSLLWRDWGKKNVWLSSMALKDLKDSEQIITELLLQSQESRRLAFSLYHSTSYDAVKLGCLKSLGELIARETELRQSLGLIQKSPTTIIGEIQMSGLTFEADPDIKSLMVAFSENFKKEKEAQDAATINKKGGNKTVKPESESESESGSTPADGPAATPG